QQQRGLTKDRAFSILSRFLFRWQDMDQCIGTLSGGQKSRVQLAKLMAADVNFLLLDEPTNHLDIYSREHVENALEAFKGTILVISHDRYFLDRIVEVDEKTLVDHEENFSEYWRRKKEKKDNRY
ncbi:MAG: ATP-binding cassette domain-containing protein, partial [Candidatus Latescibacterota bacterium]